MPNSYFQFKQFTVQQDRCAMKVTTDACLFGAWIAKSESVGRREFGGRSQEFGDWNELRVLDIGTGTGLLSLMLAQETSAIIDTIEIDKDAFEQAKENVASSPWKDRINLYCDDVTQFVFPHKYDLIISNPPFYENELKSSDEKKNIAHHGGLTLSDLVNVIFKNLEVSGEFFLLLPSKRAVEAGLLLAKYHLQILDALMVRQSTEHDYFRVCIRGRHTDNSDVNYTKHEMAIWNDRKEYTSEFISLLKNYYLYL